MRYVVRFVHEGFKTPSIECVSHVTEPHSRGANPGGEGDENAMAVACGQLAFSDTERKRIQAEVIARHDAASAAMAQVPSRDSRTRPN